MFVGSARFRRVVVYHVDADEFEASLSLRSQLHERAFCLVLIGIAWQNVRVCGIYCMVSPMRDNFLLRGFVHNCRICFVVAQAYCCCWAISVDLGWLFYSLVVQRRYLEPFGH